jgi:TIR domain/SIR2-like domain
VENSTSSDKERQELRILIKQIKSESGCVLVLGPRVAIRANDPSRRPLDELLASELHAQLGQPASEMPTLRRAADAHFRQGGNRDGLELLVQDFYAREANSTTDFHRDLARLPFRLCISASPDSLMLTAFKEASKSPQKGYYGLKPPKRASHARVSSPTIREPLVYYLLGHHEEPESLVLTEADLIDFLVQIIGGDPPVPDEVRSILRDPVAAFLFLGFGFQNWYMRVLLKVMDVHGHRSNAVAFEDPQFFALPESKEAIAFFSGDRRIDFRQLRWEPFAQLLRETYEESLPRSTAVRVSMPAAPGPSAPMAFLSYASEDQEDVDTLAAELEARGIRAWQDKANLRAGDNWNEVLLGVIRRKVDYVIVVQTHAMTTAISGVFQREIEAALKCHAEMGYFDDQRLRFLVPVRMGACPLLPNLSDFHTIDIRATDGVDLLVESIMEDWDNRAKLKLRQGGAA